jgi:hypothetical protein
MSTDLSSAGDGLSEGGVMYRPSNLSHEEERLVAGCLRREERAWETMFRLYHPRLVSIIGALIQHGEGAIEQAEEIAAVVWSSLCCDAEAPLGHYDAQGGRLLGHLTRLARRELWRGRRSDRSRIYRECKAARLEATVDDISGGLDIQDFLATLTRREREFFFTHLMRQSTHTVPSDLSSTNGWQLRCRVLKKFRRFFFGEKSD